MALALRGKRDKLGKGPWGSYGKSAWYLDKEKNTRAGVRFHEFKKKGSIELTENG